MANSFSKNARPRRGRVDRGVHDSARQREHYRLSHRARFGLAVVDRELGMHRFKPVVRALRRRRSSGLFAFRFGPGKRRGFRRRVGNGAHSEESARGIGRAELREDDWLARDSRTCRSRADRCRRKFGRLPSASRKVWSRCTPTSSRLNIESPNGQRAGCLWTTTKTPGDARCRPCIRSGPNRMRRSRRR